MLSLHGLEEDSLELLHLVQTYLGHQGVGTAVKDCDLLADSHRGVLRLNQNRIVLPSLVQRHCRHLVHIRREFRERLEFIELSLVDLQGTGHLLHGFHLSRSTDSGDGDAHIDSRTLSLVEEGRLEVDLAVGDRDGGP